MQEEAGTKMYTLHRDMADAGKFLFYELYKDKESLDYHRSQTYVKEIISSTSGLVEDKPIIELYEEISSIDR